jgi:hypothetical protein
MIHRSTFSRSVLGLLLCFSMGGCGPGTLVMTKHPTDVAPWCGPNQRVQIGQRVVGKVGFGENKWKTFLVDAAGKEHDPEKLADQAWSYLERTGDAKTIKEAFSREGCYSSMAIVSIKPVVVILETYRRAPAGKQSGALPERYYWVAQIYALRDPFYKEGLRWFSPDLKQSPVALAFSETGVAEIPLPNGKLTLIREGDTCKTMRE